MDREKLIKFITEFEGKKITIIGDLMIDCYQYGSSHRLSPEAPVPVMEIERTENIPGGAANTANNIQQLGGQAQIMGVVGQDREGENLKKLLKERGINTQGIITSPQRPTTTKTRVICQSQHIVRIDREKKETISEEIQEKILLNFKRDIHDSSIILLSDYAKGVLSPQLTQKIIEISHQENKKVLVDPKGLNYQKYQGADLLVPNLKEFAIASGSEAENQKQLLDQAKEVKKNLNLKSILITLGDQGMILLNSENKIFQIPALKIEAVDVSGCGDTAIAVFALSLASGTDEIEASTLATYASGLVVQKMGTAVIKPKELKSVIEQKKIDCKCLS